MQILQDIKYSLRLLRKTPAFTVITFLIIAVGLALYMAANTLAASLFDKPLPFPDGDRYVVLKTTIGNNETGIANHDLFTFNQLLSSSENYSTLGAFSMMSRVFSDGDYARTYQGAAISEELISATGVAPILGRSFEPADANQGAESTILISQSLWQEYYAGTTDIVGRTSQIDGKPSVIIGVMPEGFGLPIAEKFWVPLTDSETSLPGEGVPISIVGVLSDDSDLRNAGVEIEALISRLAVDYPEQYANRTEIVTPYAALISPSNLGIGNLLNFITLTILLLMTINLSSLFFIRSASRQHELAIRSSVGAVGWQLAKQVLVESFLICSGGLFIGVVLTQLMLSYMENGFLNALPFSPFWLTMDLDLSVLMSGVIATLLTWLAAGFFVAFRAYRTHSAFLLSSSDKFSGGQSKGTMMKMIVSVEVVLSSFLLICCGVTIYLVGQVTNSDYGIETENYLLASFSLNTPAYNDIEAQQGYLRQLNDLVFEIPGVSSVAFSTAPPGMRGQSGRFEVEDRDLSNDSQFPEQASIWVSENYFSELGIPPVSGREFDGSDSADSEQVVVISEQLATQLWEGESAIGRRIRDLSNDQNEWLTIIGVVPTVLQNPFGVSRPSSRPSLYRPMTQNSPSSYFLMAKSTAQVSLRDFEESIKLSAANVDREIPLENFQTLDRMIYFGQGGVGVVAEMFTMFSLAALALAGIGIYGVITRTVSQRTHEIGIRRAVGSTNAKILVRFLKQGFYFMAVGVILGVAPACLIVVSFIANTLDVNAVAYLPAVTIAVISIMAFLIAMSCYLPTRRALFLEPGDALRYE